MYVAADISLGVGVGVVALGLATVLLATRPKEAKARSAYVFDIKPTFTGAVTTIAGSF